VGQSVPLQNSEIQSGDSVPTFGVGQTYAFTVTGEQDSEVALRGVSSSGFVRFTRYDRVDG